MKPEVESKKKSSPVKRQAAEKKNANQASSNGKLAIVLVRGFLHMNRGTVDALYSLRIRQKHACAVIEDIPRNRAVAVKCKDYVTYGEISEDTYKELVDKRGEKDASGAMKKYFRLHPPRGGFERKGIKVTFTNGGVLGYRGDKMNELIRKML